MATLNVKNVPDGLYRKLQRRAKKGRRSIPQEVTHILERALQEPEILSILDLQGLGKECWKDIRASRHVDEERLAWD